MEPGNASSDASTLGQIVLGLVTVLGFAVKEWRDRSAARRMRQEQERRVALLRGETEAAAEQLRRQTEANALLIADALASRHRELAQQLAENTTMTKHAADVAEKAFTAANSFNAKWAAFREKELQHVAEAAATHLTQEAALSRDTNERVRRVEEHVVDGEDEA